MRHPLRDLRLLYYGVMGAAKDPKTGEITTACEAPTACHAAVQPLSGQAAAAEYGERLPYVYALSGCDVPLVAGMGIWLDASPTAEPDYRVLRVAAYPRECGYVIGKRGVFGG